MSQHSPDVDSASDATHVGRLREALSSLAEDPRGHAIHVPGIGKVSMGGSSSSVDPMAHPHISKKDKTEPKIEKEHDTSNTEIQGEKKNTQSDNGNHHAKRQKGILEKLGIEGREGEIWRATIDPITHRKVAVRDQVSHYRDLRKLGLDGEDRTGLRRDEDESSLRSSESILQPLGPELTSWNKVKTAEEDDSHKAGQSDSAHLHMFPPIDWHSHHYTLNSQYIKMSIALLLGILFVAIYPKSIFAVLPTSILTLFYTKALADSHLANAKWDTDRQRGQKMALHDYMPESVEWLNGVLEKIWPLINSDLFTPIVDLLEDAMQAQIPAIVHGVQIADMSQGQNPIRVSFLRMLPDQEPGIDKDKNKEQQNDQSSRRYVNVEMAFVYRARPRPVGRKTVTQDENMRLVVYLYIGLKNFVSVTVPVWVEMVGITGTARARLELLPDPPFVGQATVSLMGLPRIEISATPLMKGLLNVMNLPLISRYVLSCMNAVAAEFVAPRSYTLNLAKALLGDDVKKDTDAIGLLIVVIHSGVDLMASDANSKSDPYVTLAWEQFGKPLYSSRIILGDLEPVWEETAFILVHATAVRANERLCCTVWDSDRLTADDILGLASVSLQDLVRKNGQMDVRDDDLEAFGKRGEKGQGRLKWSVGFFGKNELSLPSNHDAHDSSKHPQLPRDLQDFPGLQKQKPRLETLMPNLQEHLVHSVGPPDDLSLGILSIQIHQIMDLELVKIGGSLGKRQEGFEDADVGHIEEEGEKLPSSYCSIVINGEKIYTTRVKPVNSRPFFNAGTERVVRDWRNCTVMIIVRDSRLRESDPILGVVKFELSEQLAHVSQMTDIFPLNGGIAHGRVRISLLFRSAGPSIPAALSGWQIGVLDFGAKISARNLFAKTDEDEDYDIKVECGALTKTFESSSKTSEHDELVWRSGQLMSFPIRRRYTTAAIITFHKKVPFSVRQKPRGMAVLYLKFLKDDEKIKVTLPIWKTDNWERLKANCFEKKPFDEDDTEHTYFDPSRYAKDPKSKDTSKGDEAVERQNLEQVGTISFQIRFRSGIDELHRDLAKSEPNFGDAYEGWKIDQVAAGKKGLDPPADDRRKEASEDGHQNTERLEAADGQDSQSSEIESDESWDSLSHEHREKIKGAPFKPASLKGRWKEWKENQSNLNRQHRGIMQSKKARSAAWISKSARNAATSVSNKFSIEERQPDIETEV